jgi:RNA polymerase sigma-70 factor (ECF subfamily)
MTLNGSCSLPDVLARLVQKVGHGDEAAFHELYALTHVRVTQVVTATVRSPEHASEVVQEVYLYLWLNACAFDELRGSVLGWLMMLGRRRAVDRVRHVARAHLREQLGAATAERTMPDVAELGLARHEAARLRGAVGRLSALQRDAVSLTFLDGYTHEQAARLLSVPLGTLKTRVRSGVINLRQQLLAAA